MKNNKKIKILTLLVIIMMTFIISYYYGQKEHTAYVENGVLDFSDETIRNTKAIPLNGQWEFYWMQLLESNDFKIAIEPEPDYINVPGNWRKVVEHDSEELRGYGTYRIKINNVEPNRQYALKKKNIRIASRIYVDGKLLIEDGKVGTSAEYETMGNSPKVVEFWADSDTIEIIIQTSSFQYYGGGIAEPMTFGYAKDMAASHLGHLTFEVFNMALIVGVGLLYVMFAFMVPKFTAGSYNAFLFPVAILMFAVINAVLGERVLGVMFPWISYEWLIRIEFIAIGWAIVAISLFIYSIAKEIFPKIIRDIFIGVALLFDLATFVAPMDSYNFWAAYVYFTDLVFFIIFVWLALFYIFDKRDKIDVIEHTFLLLFLYAVNIYNLDIIMLTVGVSSNKDLSVLASTAYALIWLYFMLYRFKEAYNKNRELSDLLVENYKVIADISEERKKSEIALLQAQIKPHFLFNVLTAIAAISGTDGNKARELIMDLADFLRRSFTFDKSLKMVTIEEELEYIQAYVKIQNVRFYDEFDLAVNLKDYEDVKIPRLILQPLIENSIKHGVTKKEEKGLIEIEGYRQGEQYILIVRDNGIGMSREKIDGIFEKEVRSTEGVGLANINKRLKAFYNTELVINTEPGHGTEIIMTIDLKEVENG